MQLPSKINLNKCIFGALIGKFLKYLVTEREIEANLENIQILYNVQSLKTIQEV